MEDLEWQTRKNRIDGRLQDLGWDVVPYEPGASLASDRCYAVTEFETDNGPADYALCVNGQILGLVQARLATATARVEQLTQAILAKAFRGELVPTEAELARREGREYEPADVLLARIRAERSRPEHRIRTVVRRKRAAKTVRHDE